MSRPSNYNHDDIVRIAGEKGFEYLDGEIHTHSNSKHRLICRVCSGKQTKRSRQIVSSKKGGCIYLPCHPRGKPTAAYLVALAAAEGVTLDLLEAADDPASFIIDPEQTLTWRKDGKVMKQSWYAVHNRFRKTNKLFLDHEDAKGHCGTRVTVKGQIHSVPDALKILIRSGIDPVESGFDTWGKLRGVRPAFCQELEAVGLKDSFMKKMNWKSRVEYKDLTDDDLLQLAANLVIKNDFVTIGQLENAESGLVKVLRKRNLIGNFCARVGIALKNIWKGKTYDQILAGVQAGGYTGSSHWHECQVGAYKYASEAEWLEDIQIEMRWGNYIDANGRAWLSIGECVVANILIEAGVTFVPNPPIPGAIGPKGGTRRSDFYLPHLDLWIEVWGFFSTPEVFARYKTNRADKESYYKNAGYKLCSLEAIIIHKNVTVGGVYYKKGQETYERYARKVLAEYVSIKIA